MNIYLKYKIVNIGSIRFFESVTQVQINSIYGLNHDQFVTLTLYFTDPFIFILISCILFREGGVIWYQLSEKNVKSLILGLYVVVSLQKILTI